MKIVMWLDLYLQQMHTKGKDLFQMEKRDLKKHVCTTVE
jgi:hypothetical protein